jgi:hypothetical protein
VQLRPHPGDRFSLSDPISSGDPALATHLAQTAQGGPFHGSLSSLQPLQPDAERPRRIGEAACIAAFGGDYLHQPPNSPQPREGVLYAPPEASAAGVTGTRTV